MPRSNAQPVTPLASTHNLDRTVKDDVADEWRQTLMVIVRRTAIIFVVIVVTRNVAKNKHSITLKLHTRTNTKHHQPIDQTTAKPNQSTTDLHRNSLNKLPSCESSSKHCDTRRCRAVVGRKTIAQSLRSDEWSLSCHCEIIVERCGCCGKCPRKQEKQEK